MGVQNTAATYGNTGEASATDFLKGTVAMETGAYDSFNNIKEGKGTWQDYVGMAMMFAPVGQGKRDLENGLKNEPEGTGSKADDAEGKKADEEDGAPKAEVQDGDAPKQEADAEAYEADLLPENELLPDEGNVGTYKELIDNGSKGDNITPHHMPSDAFMSKNNVEGYTRNEGISMNMEQPHPGTGGRHRQTSTYDNNMTKAEQQAYWDLSPREALARDIMDARKIYQEQGLYTPEIRQSLQDVINQNKLKYPQVFNK